MQSIEVGKRIRTIRIAQGMTMTDFAEQVGACRALICKWEHGHNMPNNARLKTIAEIGNMPMQELLYGKEVPEKLGAFIAGLVDAIGPNLGEWLNYWEIEEADYQAIRAWCEKQDMEVSAWPSVNE